MSIEYRGDNKYRFRVRKDGVNYYQNYISDKPISEKDLQEKKYPKAILDAHKDFEVSVLRSEIGSNGNMKFGELAQLVLDEYARPNLKPNTIKGYISAYNTHILNCFGGMQISKITSFHVQKFINEISKNLKPNSVSDTFKILRVTFNKAIEWKFIKENPCKGTTRPKIAKTNYNELLSADEIKRLLAAISNENNKIYRMAFTIAIGCGLRQGEILGLTFDDIDLDNRIITVNKQWGITLEDSKNTRAMTTTKTENSIRKVYAPGFVMDCVDEYIKALKIIPSNKLLFWNASRKAVINRIGLTRRFKKLLKENDIREIRFHDLRHLQATMLINSGVNVAVIAKRLGDSTKTILDTYTHPIEEMEKQSVQQLENFIENII